MSQGHTWGAIRSISLGLLFDEINHFRREVEDLREQLTISRLLDERCGKQNHYRRVVFRPADGRAFSTASTAFMIR